MADPGATRLARRVFPVWGLDFHGFGQSDPWPQMAQPAEANSPLGRAEEASQQLEPAMRFIVRHHDGAAPAGPVDANEQQC